MHQSSIIITVLLFGSAVLSQAQTEYAYQTFDDTRVVNGHSIETNATGILKFIISHRFGTLSQGPYDVWGLDNASMRIGLDYGISDRLTIGIGRSTFEKTADGYFKWRFLTQSSGDRKVPLSIALFGSTAFKAQRRTDDIELDAAQKLSYTTQLFLARKFSPRFSLQLMPSYLHRNLVNDDEENDIFSLGGAAQFHISKNWSISAEYYYTPDEYLPDGTGPSEKAYHAAAIGIQIDTKGHVFQFQFGNSTGMIEKFFIAETTGNWLEGDIHFGFNITRDFKIKGRKIR